MNSYEVVGRGMERRDEYFFTSTGAEHFEQGIGALYPHSGRRKHGFCLGAGHFCGITLLLRTRVVDIACSIARCFDHELARIENDILRTLVRSARSYMRNAMYSITAWAMRTM